MKWPSLSIIIPTLNQGEFIERAILSVLKQKYEGELQLIVADGGSTDGTIEILKKYPQVIWWSKPDNGILEAVFKALEVATGEVITILPSDDFYLRNAFKKAIPFLTRNPDIDLVSGALVLLKEDRKDFFLSKKQYCKISNPLQYILNLDAVVISLQVAFVRRCAYDKIGGFRMEAEQCCDVDLLYRMLHFFKGLVIPEYLGVFQIRPNQKSRSNPEEWITSLKFMVESCEKNEEYSKIFQLPRELKRELYLKWEMAWYNCAGGIGGKNKAKKIAEDINRNKNNFSKDLIEYARHFLILDSSQNITMKRNVAKKIGSSIINGSIFQKVKNLLVYKWNKRCIDINWWQDN